MKRNKTLTPRDGADRVVYLADKAAWDRLLYRLTDTEQDPMEEQGWELVDRIGAPQDNPLYPRYPNFDVERMLRELRLELERLQREISRAGLPS